MPEDNEAKRDASQTNKSNSDSSTRSNSKQQKVNNPSRKAIHDTVNYVRNKVKAFKKEHLGARSNFDFADCSKCLEEDILPAWKMPAEVIYNCDEFLQLTLRREINEDVVGSDEYIDLISICKRAQAFDILVYDSRSRLLKCLKQHVHPFCVSLKEMAGEELSIAVSDYDDKVCQHHKRTDSKIEELKQSFKSYRRLMKPFAKFVKDGDEHTTLMNQACNNLLELCKLMENWVTDDAQYPAKLLQEIESNKKVKDNLKNSLLQIEDKRTENMYEIQKLKKSEFRAENSYIEHRKEKNKLKARILELENKKLVLAEKTDVMRKEQDKLKKLLTEKSIKAARDAPYNQEKLEILEADIEKLEGEKKKTDGKLKKGDMDLKSVADRTYEHKVEAVTCRHEKEELVKENKKLEIEIKSINERIKTIDANNDMLVRIREAKLTPGLLQKYIKDKQKRDASISCGGQDLTDACRIAAPYIGKDWQKVYLSLPFDPPRDTQKRQYDMGVLDNIAARNDITFDNQALKSLEKWRVFHRHGSVRELIHTLRCVKKKQLARKLEYKFVVAAT